MERVVQKFTLKACRVNANLTQEKIAVMLGITRAEYIRWEKGRTKLKDYQKEKCADICGVPIDIINFF